MKKALLYIIGMAAAMTSCVSYEAEDFTGHTLPRKTGYSTGVTNDWLYFDLKTGHRYNVLNPNQSVIAYIDGKPVKEYFHYKGTAKLVKYWSEGVQKNIFEDAERDENGDTIFTKNSATGKLTYKTVKRQANSILVMENKEDDPNTMVILPLSGTWLSMVISSVPTVVQVDLARAVLLTWAMANMTSGRARRRWMLIWLNTI